MESYIKLVLTIIAVCLSLLALKEVAVIPDALAQSDITKVTICGPDGRHCGDDWIIYVADVLDVKLKPYVLIAWLSEQRMLPGGGLAMASSSISQEFFSQAACRTAGERMKKGVGLSRSESRDYSPAWNYICTPKGQ